MESRNSPQFHHRIDEEEAPPISFDITRKLNEEKANESNDQQNAMMPPPSKKSKDEDIHKGGAGLSSSDQLFEQAQALIAEINGKRKNDTLLLEDFKKTMDMKMESCCSILEKSLFQKYENVGGSMQDKLQDLYATLDRISKLEQELVQFKNALALLYNDVATS